jgi:serine/threonine protein kinase/pimeloyl-ACP methyl ester carboxylesterase
VQQEATRPRSWEPPETFDHFTVLGPLGRGGMGQVFLARDTALDRKVALKFIAGTDPESEDRERFLVEARAIARLAHPNVVSIFRIGEVQDRPYIAYELVEGRTLDTLPKPLDWPTALRIATGLARGLAAVHRAGILHRDIKPANIILSHEGTVKLLDFGLAKLSSTEPEAGVEPTPIDVEGLGDPDGVTRLLEGPGADHAGRITRPGTIMGTPAYLAPELWHGLLASPRSDVYALGLVLYELVTGPLQYASMPLPQLALTISSTSLASVRTHRTDIPEALADIIDRCVRKEPAERYPSGDELSRDLEAVQSVFVSVGAAARSTKSQDNLVRQSLARVSTDEVVRRMYERLFEAHPGLRAMFPADMSGQWAKVAHALRLAIEALDEPEKTEALLEELGRRHVGYGVTEAHLEMLGAVLIGALRECDRAHWSDELDAAWRSAFGRIVGAMRRGYVHPSATGISRRLDGELGWVEVDHGHLAYQCLGMPRGADVLVVPGLLSRFDGWSYEPEGSAFVRGLASAGRTILFDRIGLGASDRLPPFAHPFLDEELDHLDALLDATSSSGAMLVALGEGAPLALLYAAVRPERVNGLVVWSGAASFTDEAARERLETRARRWGTDEGVSSLGPRWTALPHIADWLSSWEHDAGSRREITARAARLARTDVRAALPFVRVPTLVLHREHDPYCPLEGGRLIAERVPGAQLEVVPGDAHLPCDRGDAAIADRIARFARDRTGRGSEESALATWAVTEVRPAALPAPLRASVRSDKGRRRTLRVDRPGLGARAFAELASRGALAPTVLLCLPRSGTAEDAEREADELASKAPFAASPLALALVEGTTGIATKDGTPRTEVEPDEPAGTLEELGTLAQRAFTIRVEPPSRLVIEGSLTLRDPERMLFGHFLRVHRWAAQARVSLTLDIRGLEQINSAALGLFVRWIGWIRAEPEERRYQLTLETDPSVIWQRSNLVPLQMIAPEVLIVVT